MMNSLLTRDVKMDWVLGVRSAKPITTKLITRETRISIVQDSNTTDKKSNPK